MLLYSFRIVFLGSFWEVISEIRTMITYFSEIGTLIIII